MKTIYRYFARTTRPSDIPPFPVTPVNVYEYEQPMDSGNGKKMYGFLDYAQPLDAAFAAQYGLEAAPINPIEVP